MMLSEFMNVSKDACRDIGGSQRQYGLFMHATSLKNVRINLHDLFDGPTSKIHWKRFAKPTTFSYHHKSSRQVRHKCGWHVLELTLNNLRRNLLWIEDALANGCKIDNCCTQDHCYQRLGWHFRIRKWKLNVNGHKNSQHGILNIRS